MPPPQNRPLLRRQNPKPSQIRPDQRSKIPKQVPRPREHRQAIRRPPRRPPHLHHHGVPKRRRVVRPHPPTSPLHRTRSEPHHEISNQRHSVHAQPRRRPPGPQARKHSFLGHIRQRQSQNRRLWLRSAQTRPENRRSRRLSQTPQQKQRPPTNALLYSFIRRTRSSKTSFVHQP